MRFMNKPPFRPCPKCRASVHLSLNFCESCGAKIGKTVICTDCGYSGGPKEVEENTAVIGFIILVGAIILGSNDYWFLALSICLAGLMFIVLRTVLRVPRFRGKLSCPRCDSLNIVDYSDEKIREIEEGDNER